MKDPNARTINDALSMWCPQNALQHVAKDHALASLVRLDWDLEDAKLHQSATPEPDEDEHHTMDDLYEHRFALTRALVALQPGCAVKCRRNGDGSSWEGYFVVYIETPAGQVSYHYSLEHWDDLPCREVEQWHYDGHTPEITLARLASIGATPEPDERGPEVGDIVMYEFDDGSRGPREWSKWQEINDPFDREIAPSRIVVLMRRAEIEARMGGA